MESTQGGHDDVEADAHNVAIFEGHGNVNYLCYAYRDQYGYCDAGYYNNTTSSNIQIGMNGGATAALVIADTCCYMMKGSTISIATFGGIQELGFGGVSSDDNGMVDNFFNNTSGGTNWYYWLREMEDKPGWWTGDNTTVAVTRGWNSTDVANNRTNCKFKHQTCLNNPPTVMVPPLPGRGTTSTTAAAAAVPATNDLMLAKRPGPQVQERTPRPGLVNLK